MNLHRPRQRIARVVLLAATLRGLGAAELPVKPLDAFFDQHCYSCHDQTEKKGGLDLEALSRNPQDAETLRRWVRVFDRVQEGEMPPKKKARPAHRDVTGFLAALREPLLESDRAQREVVHRRLNRSEYENTVRDLFKVRAEVAKMLPEDGKAYGFDNIGEALFASTELVESYLRAADVAIDMVLAQREEPAKFRFDSTFTDGWKTRFNARQVFRFIDEGVVAYNCFQKSTHIRNFAAPVGGTYRIRFHAQAYHSTQPVKMEIGGGDVHQSKRGRHTIGFYEARPEGNEIVIEDWFRAGDGFSIVPFGIGRVRPGKEPHYPGPGLLLKDYHVEGPLENDLSIGYRELLDGADLKTGTPADARRILARLLPRAFRRPVSDEQLARYVGFMQGRLEQGYTFEAALRVGLRAVLCSPEFLFLSEPADQGKIDDYALASRLSYFLWSSMPDDELVAAAGRGELSRPATLRAQVERLLASPKAAAFTKNFTGQWLKLRDIKATEPDTALYPEFDTLLEYSLLEETLRFFDEVVRDNRSVMEFVDSDWTILNDRLATHYGIGGVTGVQFRRAAIPKDSVRGGVMTQASILKITANGTTTSPVTRGLWTIENLLGVHVPPPPNVPAVEPDLTGATTLRQQLDQHRNDTSCASCHNKIDPAGFALENFDAIGGWRERYRIPGAMPAVATPRADDDPAPAAGFKLGLPVDASGALLTGESFHDIRELKALLKRDPERVARGVTEKLLTYGLGRGVGFSDRATVEGIVQRAKTSGYGFRALIQEVVLSDAFARP